ncbi:MAG: M3 family oligoendopeptidase, partial [Clostridia bacterium]
AALASNVKKNCFYSRVRGYKSAREMCLSEDNIPCDVYDNLIKAVDESLPSLQKYLALRQRALGLSELHMYDLYTPIVACETRKYTYEEACELVLESVAPLGDTYVKDMTRALSSGWVDVYENRGKTSGAYSWGSNGAHPFVLLNFEGTLDDVFTLAHEMGHAMHSFYTNCEQPSVYKQYKIFVAEVASTVNENLLMAHLLEITKDTKTRMYLQNHRLEGFRTTVFRQTMFAEFERDIHAQYESGVALTAEKLCDIYYKLNEKYFAENVTVDREIAYEWARIPHFYSDFYVYQYATGYSAAVTLADGILNDKKAAQRYIQFLSSGDSAYPIELLKRAGVDLTEPTAVAHALAHFSAAVEELTKYIQNS